PQTGEIVTYSIKLINPGSLLSGVRMTDTLPAELDYRGDLWASSGSYAQVGNLITWHGSVLTASMVLITYTANISLTNTIARPIVNTALVDDGLGDVRTYQATVIANGYPLSLPLIRR
ncbi:MAG TPA: hypothetical protein VLG46_03875, partial [Anaerolineae bacterium]|nr:hypothetical protein [Anaerolineae bacterium]